MTGIAWHLKAGVQHAVSPPLVPTASVVEVLSLIHSGTKVIFVDAREREEYDESHIPGALNLTLRDLQVRAAELDVLLGDADVVVAYCLKDFRGFEVARALREHGVTGVHTLREFGMAGWTRAGLPVDRAGAGDDRRAAARLVECADHPDVCRKART